MDPRENLILVPVYVKQGDSKMASTVTARIQSLIDVGRVFLVSQGERLHFSPPEEDVELYDIPNGEWRIRAVHVDEPIGVWGAMNRARLDIEKWPQTNFGSGGIRRIVFNTAPLYYGADVTERILVALVQYGYDLAVGYRTNIAGSLSSDSVIGKVRAHLEVFLSRLAEVVSGLASWVIRDGFCGLQALPVERFRELDWEWITKQKTETPWGGELVVQMQFWSRKTKDVLYSHLPLQSGAKRTWSSSFGIDAGVIVQMLDRARDLPMFESVAKGHVDNALYLLEKASDAAWFQPWFDPTTAADEVCAALHYYNENTTRGRWLEWQ